MSWLWRGIHIPDSIKGPVRNAFPSKARKHQRQSQAITPKHPITYSSPQKNTEIKTLVHMGYSSRGSSQQLISMIQIASIPA